MRPEAARGLAAGRAGAPNLELAAGLLLAGATATEGAAGLHVSTHSVMSNMLSMGQHCHAERENCQ